MSVSEARQHLGDVVNRVCRGEGRVDIGRSGIPVPVAAVVSLRDFERLQGFERRPDAGGPPYPSTTTLTGSPHPASRPLFVTPLNSSSASGRTK